MSGVWGAQEFDDVTMKDDNDSDDTLDDSDRRAMTYSDDMFCKTCGYALKRLPESRCPECGRRFDPRDAATYSARQRLASKQSHILLAYAIPFAASVLIWTASDMTTHIRILGGAFTALGPLAVFVEGLFGLRYWDRATLAVAGIAPYGVMVMIAMMGLRRFPPLIHFVAAVAWLFLGWGSAWFLFSMDA